MKILFFSFGNLTTGGGFQRYVILLARELANIGNNVSIVTINRNLQYKLEIFLNVYYLNPKSSLKGKFRLSQFEIKQNLKGVSLYEVSSLSEMKKHLKNADVIYSKNEILDLSILKMLKSNEVFPPIVCGVHTPIFYPVAKSLHSKLHNFLYLNKLYESMLKMCSGIHALNSDETKIIRKNFSNVKAKIYYTPCFLSTNIVDLKKFKASASKFNILFVGRLTEQKGIDTLKKIIGLLSHKPEFKDMVFTIAGSGMLESDVIKLSSRYYNVNHVGHIQQEQMLRLYLSNDIFLIPTRWETFSYVCLEAQSFGLPVIVSDIPGPRDIIANGRTGFLVEPENIGAFAKKILYLYYLKKNNFEGFKLMKETARRYVNKFSKRNIVQKMERMFSEISQNHLTHNFGRDL